VQVERQDGSLFGLVNDDLPQEVQAAMTPAKDQPHRPPSGRPALVEVDGEELDAESQISMLSARVRDLERERDGLEDFAARAAHELVAPLVMTEAYAAMIATRLDAARDREALRDLDSVSRAAAQARRLVEALLAEARIGDEPLERRPVDLNGIVSDVVATLRPEIATRAAEVHVGVLPTVQGEPTLLSGLFTNLIVNGLRYGPRERSRIEIAAAREHHDAWRITIDSDGPTVNAEDCERIFAPYQRGQHERRTRGTGLGLAICRRVVERHGGRIGVLPLATGNRFWFTLSAQ
jgi:light-regulated signal transduction histidine kinase (bacteriophytochrome)